MFPWLEALPPGTEGTSLVAGQLLNDAVVHSAPQLLAAVDAVPGASVMVFVEVLGLELAVKSLFGHGLGRLSHLVVSFGDGEHGVDLSGVGEVGTHQGSLQDIRGRLERLCRGLDILLTHLLLHYLLELTQVEVLEAERCGDGKSSRQSGVDVLEHCVHPVLVAHENDAAVLPGNALDHGDQGVYDSGLELVLLFTGIARVEHVGLVDNQDLADSRLEDLFCLGLGLAQTLADEICWGLEHDCRGKES